MSDTYTFIETYQAVGWYDVSIEITQSDKR